MNSDFDIIDFINSSDIAKHCCSIGYSFSALEMAYLIWVSRKRSIREKHSAWHNLIDTQPDMEIAERPGTPYIKSLHTFLLRFMELENKYLALFYQEEPCCIYSFSICYPGNEDYSFDNCVFPSFQMCFDAINAELTDIFDYVQYIRIKKQWICQSSSETVKSMEIYIDSIGTPWSLGEDRQIISEEDNEILDAFRGMWPEIPTPFKRGDILISNNQRVRYDGPFVLDTILYWKDTVPESTIKFLRSRGDESDLEVNVYTISSDNSLCHDHGPCYLDMEYYNAPLDDSQKFLSVLSGYIKGEYDITVLFEAYDYLKDAKRRKASYDCLCAYKNSHLIAAGFGEVNNDR